MIYTSSNNGRHPVTKIFTQLHSTSPNYTSLHYTGRHFTFSHLNFTQLHFTNLSFGLTHLNFLLHHFTSLNCTFRLFSPHFSSFHKVLRNMVNAPWCVRKNDSHRDLQVDVVTREIQSFAQKHERRLHHNENIEAVQLLDNMGIVRRLQRKKPFELV